MNNPNEFIRNEVETIVRKSSFAANYRRPLVGFSDANHPMYGELKRIVDESHLLPADLLPGARTVVSFFVPYVAGLVRSNQKDVIPTESWAHAKKDTEEIINAIIERMRLELASQGVRCSENPGIEPYDRTKFLHRWSQKHVAYISGLGNFGLNHLLITEKGCAGRLGSFVIDVETDYDSIVTEEFCPYKVDGACGVCVNKCPPQALSYAGLEKAVCSKWQDDITDKYFEGISIFRSCGKCITLPCALRRPKCSH